MAKVIVISNQKGGVAKTTSTQAIAAVLKQRGYRVLAIDFDSQGNLSDSVGILLDDDDTTIFEVLKRDVSITDTIQRLPAFDIIPADIMLASAEHAFTHAGKEHRLKEALEPIQNMYDYILIDTPPSLGFLTGNAFTAADDVLIPTTAGKFSVKGIKELFDTCQSVKKYYNNDLTVRGIFFTKFDPRTNNSKEMRILTEKLSDALNVPLFTAFIRNRVAVEDAQSRSQDILSYKDCEDVTSDYNSFVDEYLNQKKGIERYGKKGFKS